jgi:hypothetical protein
MRDTLKKALRVGLGLAATVGALVVLAGVSSALFYGWLRTSAGNRWLGTQIETSLDRAATGGTVSLGQVETNLQNQIVFHDLNIRDAEGETLVWVGRGQTGFSLVPLLLRRELDLTHLQLDSALVDLTVDEGGVSNIGRVFGQVSTSPSAEPWEGLPIRLRAPNTRLNGVQIRYRDPTSTEVLASAVHAVGDIEVLGTEMAFRKVTLHGQLVHPGPSVVSARGSVLVGSKGVQVEGARVEIPGTDLGIGGKIGGGEVDLHIDVHAVDLPALEPILNNPGLGGRYAGSLALTGPLSAAQVTGQLSGIDGTQGSLVADAQANLSAESITWTAEVALENLNVKQLYPSVAQEVVLAGEATLNGRGLRFPDDFELTVAYRGDRQDVFGQTIDAVETTFTIANGSLKIANGQLLGILGELEAMGDIDLVEGPMSLHITGWVRPDRLTALGITGIRSSGWVDAQLVGNLRDPDAQYDVRGTLRFQDFHYLDDVRFDTLSARFDVDVKGLDIRGRASVKGKGGNTYGLDIATLKIKELALHIPENGPLRFGGDLTVTDAVYPDTMRVSKSTGTWSFEQTTTGTQTTHADLYLGPHALLDVPGTTGFMKIDVIDDIVDLSVDLEDDRRSLLSTAGQVDLSSFWVGLERLTFAPTARASWTATRPIHLTVTDGGLEDADIAVVGNLGNIEITGTLGQTGPLDSRIVISKMQLDVLAELYPETYSGLAGEVQMDMTLTGTSNAPQILANFDATNLWMEDSFRWLEASGRLRADRDNLWPDVQIAVAGEHLANVGGRVSMDLDLADPGLSQTGDIDLDIGIRAGQIQRLKNLLPELNPIIPTGVFSGQLRCTGRAADPDFRFGGTTEIDIDGWDDPARVEFELNRNGSQVAGWADVRDGMAQRMNLGLSGTNRLSEVAAWALNGGPEPDLEDYTLYLDDMFVSGALLGFPADSLATAIGAPIEATGNVVGGFTAWGSPYTPRGEGGFHWVEATIGDTPIDGALISVTPTEDAYQLDMHTSFAPEGELSISGLVPLAIDLRKDWTDWSTGPLDLAVSGEGVPLGVASGYDPGIQRAEGLLVVSGRIAGTASDPSPELSASIESGTFSYRPLGLNIRDLNLAFTSGQGILSLDRLYLVTQPRNLRGNIASGLQDLSEIGEMSTLEMSGIAHLGERSLGDIEADVTLSGGAWVINTTNLSMRANGAINMSGTWPALIVDGDVSLFSGKVILDAASFLSAGPLATDSSLTIHRENAILTRAPDPEPSLYEDFDVTLRINMNRNLELDMSVPFIEEIGVIGAAVSRADLSARIGGSATASLSSRDLRMNGNVDLLEGKIGMLNSRFNLERGSMFFTGNDPYNPIMDIHAQMKIPEATVDLYMTGTPETPVIDLSSKEFPDKTQVLTILLTGYAPDEMAYDQMPEFLASILVSSLFAGKSLGNFSIEPDGSVRAGAPITNNIFAVTILSPTANIDENHVALEVEWGPIPKVVVSGGIGDTVSFGDVFWEVRF